MTPPPPGERGAVFVLPTTTAGQQGPVAAWLSTAGWASAAARHLGHSWIVTPAGIVGTEEARRRGSRPELTSASRAAWRRPIPTLAKTAIKDIRQRQRARRFRVGTDGPWRDVAVRFVWQRHELFHTAGVDLARELEVPSVLFVPAPVVWEARRWGVRRPGWARRLERVGEVPALSRADVVACGSELVAQQVRRLGVAPERIVITPTGVDLELFEHRTRSAATRDELGLGNGFVVGWVGSFRRFHALDLLVDAVGEVEGASLLMVGDGPERPRIEARVRDLGVPAIFTGTVAHSDLPAHLAEMDAGVVLGASSEQFHYSPLKLAEYLATGLPVVAPAVAQLVERLDDGSDALLVPPGDARALATGLRRLRDDRELRRRVGAAARASAEREWSWDHQIRRVVAALPQRPSGASGR